MLRSLACILMLIPFIGLQAQNTLPQATSPIEQLYQSMLGTFVVYDKEKGKINRLENDSIILYSVALQKPKKDEYWLLSYEFSTATPNHPVYTTIKHLKLDPQGTSIHVAYYQIPQKLNLQDIIDSKLKMDLNNLPRKNKEVVYQWEESGIFEGKSEMYVAPECHCKRQNIYTVMNDRIEVEAEFYTLNGDHKLEQKEEPSLRLRRAISQDKLQKMAAKKYDLH